MKCVKVRHVGIGIDVAHWTPTIEYYKDLGFVQSSEGLDIIDGIPVVWKKLTDGFLTIEFIRLRESHLAFEVVEIDRDKYFYVTPAGHLVQFDRDPSGNLVEFVQIKKEGTDAKKFYQDSGDAEDYSGDRDKSQRPAGYSA